jgi:hypothetical protein
MIANESSIQDKSTSKLLFEPPSLEMYTGYCQGYDYNFYSLLCGEKDSHTKYTNNLLQIIYAVHKHLCSSYIQATHVGCR